jgi:hypothetical protein
MNLTTALRKFAFVAFGLSAYISCPIQAQTYNQSILPVTGSLPDPFTFGGVAIDANGNLYITDQNAPQTASGHVYKATLSSATLTYSIATLATQGTTTNHGITSDSYGDLYWGAYYKGTYGLPGGSSQPTAEGVVDSYDAPGAPVVLPAMPNPVPFQTPYNPTVVAINSSGQEAFVYSGTDLWEYNLGYENGSYIWNYTEISTGTGVFPSQISSLAVDQSGAVYTLSPSGLAKYTSQTAFNTGVVTWNEHPISISGGSAVCSL